MSISAGMYEVTSRPTSCSRTAGLLQTFMVISSIKKLANRLSACSINETIAITFDKQKSQSRDLIIRKTYRRDKFLSGLSARSAAPLANNFRQTP